MIAIQNTMINTVFETTNGEKVSNQCNRKKRHEVIVLFLNNLCRKYYMQSQIYVSI